jgi:hypothetical protein
MFVLENLSLNLGARLVQAASQMGCKFGLMALEPHESSVANYQGDV